jgi:hypothetical protein
VRSPWRCSVHARPSLSQPWVERRDHLLAVITLASCTFGMIGKAYRTMPRRDGVEYRAELVVAQISDRGVVAAAQAELSQMEKG